MTTQDYIDAEIQRDRGARAQAMAQSQQATATGNSLQQLVNETYGNPGPSEVILLRAKVRELTDKLAAERERCVKIAEETGDTLTDAAWGPLWVAGYKAACGHITAGVRSGQ